MNMQLSPDELALLSAPIPAVPVMTRRDKLMHLADLVRGHGDAFVIFHRLEHMQPAQLAACTHPGSAFALAAQDPKLRAAGLAGESAASAIEFFELSQSDLHEFSCDCGGHISNSQMAERITKLAAGRKEAGSFFRNIGWL